MKCYYDFHIHTALSPCGDDDMTPNNIVNMSVLKGLDAIAVTDHNSAANVRACFECGKRAGIIVIPGMELETSEDVHILALFDNPDGAEKLSEIVSCNIPTIKNRVDIFGHQYVMDEEDNVVSEVENLLSTATKFDVYDATKLINELGGIAIPAHIDKSSYSIISNLGFIPQELDFSVVEIKKPSGVCEFLQKHKLHSCTPIFNSDAHFLWDINEREHFFDAKLQSAKEIIDYLKQKK